MKTAMQRFGNRNAVTHGMTNTPEYVCWLGMVQRCYDEGCRLYSYYGERGIKVCNRWRNSFATFLADMGMKPGKLFTIERKNNNGDYTPGNCRWATRKEQARNRRTNRLLTINGETKTLAEWCDITRLRHNTILRRLFLGWSVEAAVLTPARSCVRGK